MATPKIVPAALGVAQWGQARVTPLGAIGLAAPPRFSNEGLMALGKALAQGFAQMKQKSDESALANALLGGGSISQQPPAGFAPNLPGPVPNAPKNLPSTMPAPSGTVLTPEDFSPTPMQDQKPPLSGGFMPQSSAAPLTDAVAKLESNNSPNEGQVGRYVNYRYQQFPAFAKQYGTGAEGVTNYAKQVLAANPNATFGDMYGGYVTGTGNPAAANMASLQTTTQPGAQGAYANLVKNSPIPPNTPLAQVLNGSSPAEQALMSPQPTPTAAPFQVAGDVNVMPPAPQVGQFTPSDLGNVQNIPVQPIVQAPPQPSYGPVTPQPGQLPQMPPIQNQPNQYAVAADQMRQRALQAMQSGHPEVALALAQQYQKLQMLALQAQGGARYQQFTGPKGGLFQRNLVNGQVSQITPAQQQPTSVQEFNAAKTQGFNGSYADWLKQRAAWGRQQTIAPPEKGYQYKYDNQGNVISEVPIPGSSVQQKEAQQRQQQIESADIVSRDIDRAMGMANSWTTGPGGAMLQYVPGTEAHNLQQVLSGIKANVGFGYLQKMRNSSPTGGALGQVSDVEERLLQSVMGSVEQSQTKDQLMFNLRRLHNVYQDTVNGSPQELQQAVQAGKITKAQMDKALGQRYDLSGFSADGNRIPPQAIQLLRQKPDLAEQFDQKYGPGAAARILGVR